MSSKNFENFNKVTLHILVNLFDEFPTPIKIDAPWVATDLFNAESESQDTAFDKMEFVGYCISWLKEEGFISYLKREKDEFLGVRLTLKGLTLLGYSIPDNSSSTLIIQAKEAIADASQDAAKDVITNLVKMAFFNLGGVIGS